MSENETTLRPRGENFYTQAEYDATRSFRENLKPGDPVELDPFLPVAALPTNPAEALALFARAFPDLRPLTCNERFGFAGASDAARIAYLGDTITVLYDPDGEDGSVVEFYYEDEDGENPAAYALRLSGERL